MKAVVLFSGGLDSTVLLWKMLHFGYDEVIPITIKYGSNHQDAEVNASKQIIKAAWNQFPDVVVTHLSLNFPEGVFGGSDSSLMGEAPLSQRGYRTGGEGPSNTEVPFRNANFISLATTYAMKLGASSVHIATHATDTEGWAYPDCTPEFMGAMINAVWVGTFKKVRLHTPFTWMDKSDVVKLGDKLNAPLSFTWSCYKGGEYHCGVCPTCIERTQAFVKAFVTDYTDYSGGFYETHNR